MSYMHYYLANKGSKTAEIVGVTEAQCSRVWTRYQKAGYDSIAKEKRGRRHDVVAFNN
jgi:hypothetical protein